MAAESTAKRFAAEGRSLSAGDAYHRASACFHGGQYLARVGSTQRAEGWARRVRSYRKAFEHLDAGIESFEVPFDGSILPGHLHQHGRVPGAARCLRRTPDPGGDLVRGFFDFRDFPFWPVSTQLNVMEDLMLDSLAEARDYVARRCSLEGVIEKIGCPYLVIHGARDELVSVEEAERMADGSQASSSISRTASTRAPTKTPHSSR